MSTLIVGCGYLGRRVAARWIAAGRRVAATTRNRADELRALGIEPVIADVLRPESLQQLPSVKTVLYAVGFDRAAGASMRSVYVDGLQRVLAKIESKTRFIYVSSTGVYADAAGEWVDELSPVNPIDESGRIVADAELVVREMRPDAIVLRFAGIYGPGRFMREAAIRAGEPIATDPEMWLNLVHVEDGASAVLAAETHGQPGATYNVADGRPARRGDFYRKLAEVLGAPPPRFVASPGAKRGNRRIANGRMIAELKVDLRFPSYVEGLASANHGDGFGVG